MTTLRSKLHKNGIQLSPAAATACAFLAVVILFVAIGLFRTESASSEAAVTEAICRQLLENTTAGRQALVSSVWWPPLPVLLRLPLVALMGTEACPAASLVVSAMFGAAVLILLEGLFRSWRLGWMRFVLLAGLAFHPLFLGRCVDGSSGTTVIYLTLLTLHGLVGWVDRRRMRDLVYLGFGSSLLVLSSFELGLWLTIVFTLLLVDQVRTREESRSQKEAAIILGLLPALYAASLWILMNWLIMGDGLYFVRSLLTGAAGSSVQEHGVDIPTRLDAGTAATALLTFMFGVLLRRRGPLHISIACGGLLVVALFLKANGMLWQGSHLLTVLAPVVVLTGALTVRMLRVVSTPAAALAAFIPLATAVATMVQIDGLGVDRDNTLAAVARERSQCRYPIRAHVIGRSAYAKVFVCGYESFRLLGADGGDVFLHSLDFNFNKVKGDYYGQRLFVLVPRPQGHSAMESVQWKYDDIFVLGHRNTLYDEDWGKWRLFEIIQAPKHSY